MNIKVAAYVMAYLHYYANDTVHAILSNKYSLLMKPRGNLDASHGKTAVSGNNDKLVLVRLITDSLALS